jgi:hypothetical protein
MVRWVGFDMDECIGSVMPLYAFVTKLPKAYAAAGNTGNVFEDMKNALYFSENAKETWLIRPAFYDALSLLYRAYKGGMIYGAFIFSNNGSQELVDFLVYYCNGWMARKFHDLDRPSIFKMGVCRGSPLRSPGSLVKSYAEIQGALARKGLPLITAGSDLLFFDDMVHVLTSEIRDYVQVRPYVNLCPLDRVVSALSGLERNVGAEAWAAIVKLARHYAVEDSSSHYAKIPPTLKETIVDRIMFYQTLKNFLGMRAGALGKHTRKVRCARKNTLRRRRPYPVAKKYLG